MSPYKMIMKIELEYFKYLYLRYICNEKNLILELQNNYKKT